MSTRFPKPHWDHLPQQPGDQSAEEHADDHSRETTKKQDAVKTFTIEVSAGNSGDEDTQPPAAVSRLVRRLRKPLKKKHRPTAPDSPHAITPKPVEKSRRGKKTKHPTAQPTDKSAARARTPSWLVSSAIHAGILLILSFLTLANLHQEDELIFATSHVSNEVLDEFQEIEIDPTEEFEPVDTDVAAMIDDPGLAAFGELSSESALSDLMGEPSLASSDLDNFGSLFDESGNGLSEMGAGSGAPATSFFGTKAQAQRVVFVIDNTGSMNYGGLETVIAELLKSVDAMSPKQQFYVLFFSDQVYPLFYPHSQLNFVRANNKNKQLLSEWLNTVETCTGGVWQLTQALETAYELRPDVVYLLCDGRHWDLVRAAHKIKAVENLRSKPNLLGIPVHTLGMGCQEDADRENLATVAQVNSGTFHEVPVSPAMAQLAQQHGRPYHSHGPGEVWGTKVLKRSKK